MRRSPTRGRSESVLKDPVAARSKGVARGPGSLPESNSAVVSPNLHDRCFRVARQASSLYGATEGSASEAADVRLESFGLSRGLSAAADGSTLLTALSLSKWSAFPEGAIASILRDAFGGERRSGRGRHLSSYCVVPSLS